MITRMEKEEINSIVLKAQEAINLQAEQTDGLPHL